VSGEETGFLPLVSLLFVDTLRGVSSRNEFQGVYTLVFNQRLIGFNFLE
jgi:hypothetical protein